MYVKRLQSLNNTESIEYELLVHAALINISIARLLISFFLVDSFCHHIERANKSTNDDDNDYHQVRLYRENNENFLAINNSYDI